MKGITHATIGAASGLAVALAVSAPADETLFLAGLSAFAALFPDIDHPNSMLRRRIGFLGVSVFWLTHRGLTHTLLAVVLFGLAAAMLLPEKIWAVAAIAGYASHILADMVTIAGVPVFWPLSSANWHLVPRLIRVRTGGIAESLIEAAFVLIAAYLVYQVL